MTTGLPHELVGDVVLVLFLGHEVRVSGTAGKDLLCLFNFLSESPG